MNRNVTIGVALASYNGEKYISEQLNSIIEQTWKLDLIVVSDGMSSDKTVDICKELLSKQGIPYKLLTSNRQLSVTDNFEKALQKCECDYIFFSDQDDVWNLNKVEITMQEMYTHQGVLAFTNAQVTDSELNYDRKKTLWDFIGFKIDKPVKIFKKGDLEFLTILLKHNVVTGMCMCINSDLKNVVLPFHSDSLHDAWIALFAINYGNVVAINKNCVFYRQHKNNQVGITTNLRKRIKNQKWYAQNVFNRKNLIIKLMNHIGEILEKKNSLLLKSYIQYLLYRCAFLKRKVSILSIIGKAKDYKNFENNSIQIFIKDIICRIIALMSQE